MLRFGLFGDTCAPPRGEHADQRVEELLQEAQLAERVGFDSLLIGEHHQQAFGLLPSPFLVDTAIALRTERLRVGTGVLLLPLYHPVHVAEDAATLDVISKGRLILGVGQGYQA
ncbi:MAG: LLM class flavin-dependent oxidoreductase, partial [Nitrospinae bacterium]|nr:LLM class flavin-dependent oxidoreductase [Nitrospinota bacterium]